VHDEQHEGRDEEGRMPRLTRKVLPAIGVVAVLLVPLVAAPQALAATPRVTVLAGAWSSPLQLAVRGSRVLVTDGDRLREVGRAAPLATGPRGGEVAGVAFDASGGYAYATSNAGRTDTRLTIVTGGRTVTADLSGFERAHNPDGHTSYGISSPSACVRAAFKALDGGPAAYRALVASRPVAVANGGPGRWYVADAAGNDVLAVDAAGSVSLVAVLPRQGYTFSARIAQGLGLPSCVNGAHYSAEPQPTDVEVGPDGSLYVSVLPGLYDLGQAGNVYRIDPRTHRATRIASGFSGAMNVAVTSRGALYVAEVLSGRISVVRSGRAVPYVSVRNVVGVEAAGTRLYASTLPIVSMGVTIRSGHVLRIG
jgi:DNA-binding beta-propeller fold protein YncE